MSNEIRDKAYKDYCSGMKYKDIAEKYNVSLSTVKSWATRHWKVAVKGKKLRPRPRKVATSQSNKKLKEKLLESVGENEELTEKRRLFCLHYTMSHNATQAYLKTYGGDKIAAAVQGCRLLRNVKVADEVQRLQEIMRKHLDVGVSDLVQYCLKIVYADIGDYVLFEGFRVTLRDSKSIDTSVISEVKQGKDGISIKMEDKKWAWEMLAKYLGFDDMEELKKAKLQAEVAELNTDKQAETVTFTFDREEGPTDEN